MSRAIPSLVAVDEPQTVNDQTRVNESAPEIVALLHGRELIGGPVQLYVSSKVSVGPEQDNVELLDAALLLHAPIEPHRLVEHLQSAFLASTNRRSPANEQHAVGHTDPPFLHGPARYRAFRPNVPHETRPRKPCLRRCIWRSLRRSRWRCLV